MATGETRSLIDRIGIWTSSLCALHCLLLPALLPVLPLIGASMLAQGWFEKIILSMSMIFGFWALLAGFYRYHRQLYPLYSLLLGGLVYWNKGMFGEAYEPVTVVVGAFLIIAAHMINMRLCQSCQACQQCQSH